MFDSVTYIVRVVGIESNVDGRAQMVWFRENWYEEVLRQLRAGLAKCHVVAFHHRAAVADATVTQHTLNFIKKVVSTFGIGIGISEYTRH